MAGGDPRCSATQKPDAAESEGDTCADWQHPSCPTLESESLLVMLGIDQLLDADAHDDEYGREEIADD
jgi:hypothetical protein